MLNVQVANQPRQTTAGIGGVVGGLIIIAGGLYDAVINHPTRGAFFSLTGCTLFLHHLKDFLPQQIRGHVTTLRNTTGVFAVGVLGLERRMAMFNGNAELNTTEHKFVPATYAYQ